MRDRAGSYWCYACGKADSERKHGDRAVIPCPKCGKACRRGAMVDHAGLHLCQTCGYDRALKGKELAKAGVSMELPHEEEARQRLRGMLIIMSVLAFVSLYRWGMLGG